LLDLLQSLDREGYFTHFTALHLHGLTVQIPKTIYFNVEQEASGGGGTLTQEAIDRAFRGRPRKSQNAIELRGRKVYRLNGKNTGHLGVIGVKPDDTIGSIRVTNTERTLIDATVRPVYCGGVAEVAKAFSAASNRVSVNRICAYLRRLDYTYPYHQAIGFYMERSGRYQESQLDLLRQFPCDYDFYLTYQMKDPDYDSSWRLFFPKTL
jgi:predicted transcriptional regulator of viral defense system